MLYISSKYPFPSLPLQNFEFKVGIFFFLVRFLLDFQRFHSKPSKPTIVHFFNKGSFCGNGYTPSSRDRQTSKPLLLGAGLCSVFSVCIRKKSVDISITEWSLKTYRSVAFVILCGNACCHNFSHHVHTVQCTSYRWD